jgi:hypothetical protein
MIHELAINLIKDKSKDKKDDCNKTDYSLSVLRTAYLKDLSGLHFLSDLHAGGHVRSERYEIFIAFKVAAAKILLKKLIKSQPLFDIHLNNQTIKYIYHKLFPEAMTYPENKYIKDNLLKKYIKELQKDS